MHEQPNYSASELNPEEIEGTSLPALVVAGLGVRSQGFECGSHQLLNMSCQKESQKGERRIKLAVMTSFLCPDYIKHLTCAAMRGPTLSSMPNSNGLVMKQRRPSFFQVIKSLTPEVQRAQVHVHATPMD